jgi:hypothetical protein
MTYKYKGNSYHILVDNPEGVNCGVKELKLDGKHLPEGVIPLLDDGNDHLVHLRMG